MPHTREVIANSGKAKMLFVLPRTIQTIAGMAEINSKESLAGIFFSISCAYFPPIAENIFINAIIVPKYTMGNSTNTMYFWYSQKVIKKNPGAIAANIRKLRRRLLLMTVSLHIFLKCFHVSNFLSCLLGSIRVNVITNANAKGIKVK